MGIENAKPRYHAEEDGQELASSVPFVVPEDQHRGKGEQPIGGDRESEALRVVGRKVDQFEPGEGGKQNQRRPVT